MTTAPQNPAPSSATSSATSSTARTLGILSIVFGAVAFLLAPILFGPAGIVCGAIAMNKGERLGKIGLALSIAGLVVGLVLGAVFFSATH